ncbi:MAG: response regulator [Eubacteriales bacterium]
MSKRVMVVDDSAFLRLTIKNILTKHGYEVVGEAENGQIALTKYKQLKPDVVTMDITMPDTTGIEVVKAILAFDPKAKIIMCSALGQKAMVLNAIVAGAKDFIVKPFQEDRVIQAIDKVLNATQN